MNVAALDRKGGCSPGRDEALHEGRVVLAGSSPNEPVQTGLGRLPPARPPHLGPRTDDDAAFCTDWFVPEEWGPGRAAPGS